MAYYVKNMANSIAKGFGGDSQKKRRTSSSEVSLLLRSAVDDDCMQDSWVELGPPSRGSMCSSADASLQIEAQSNTSVKGSTRHSPKSLQSPSREMDSLDMVTRKLLAQEMLPPGKQTDWIWDWSSRPEAVPPKQLSGGRGARATAASTRGGALLTTPPNSPVAYDAVCVWSLRHGRLVRSQLFRVEVLVGLVVSNIVTLLLGACIGFYICKRLHSDTDLPPA